MTFGSWPSPKRDLDQRFFFSLGRYVNEFIQIISFFERISFKLRRENFIAIVLCYSRQVYCLLYCLCQITNGDQKMASIWAFIFTSSPSNFYTFVSGCGLNKNIGGSTDLVKKGTDSPLSPLLSGWKQQNSVACFERYAFKRKIINVSFSRVNRSFSRTWVVCCPITDQVIFSRELLFFIQLKFIYS